MRPFLLFLAIAVFLPLTAESSVVPNCGTITMSPLNADFNNFTASFNVSYERDAPENVNGVVIIDIKLTEWDPTAPPTVASPPANTIPMWSVIDDLYASQGRIRLRGLLLSSATQSTSPIITYGISEESAGPCFRVEQSKRFLNDQQLNPCDTELVNDSDCNYLSSASEVLVDGSISRKNASYESGGSISTTAFESKEGKIKHHLLSANPFRDDLQFSVTSTTAQTATVQLFAFTGQRVAEQSVPLYAGKNKIGLDDLGALPAGSYAYRLTDESGTTHSGIVVKK